MTGKGKKGKGKSQGSPGIEVPPVGWVSWVTYPPFKLTKMDGWKTNFFPLWESPMFKGYVCFRGCSYLDGWFFGGIPSMEMVEKKPDESARCLAKSFFSKINNSKPRAGLKPTHLPGNVSCSSVREVFFPQKKVWWFFDGLVGLEWQAHLSTRGFGWIHSFFLGSQKLQVPRWKNLEGRSANFRIENPWYPGPWN